MSEINKSYNEYGMPVTTLPESYHVVLRVDKKRLNLISAEVNEEGDLVLRIQTNQTVMDFMSEKFKEEIQESYGKDFLYKLQEKLAHTIDREIIVSSLK